MPGLPFPLPHPLPTSSDEGWFDPVGVTDSMSLRVRALVITDVVGLADWLGKADLSNESAGVTDSVLVVLTTKVLINETVGVSDPTEGIKTTWLTMTVDMGIDVTANANAIARVPIYAGGDRTRRRRRLPGGRLVRI